MKRAHPTVYIFLPNLINLAILQLGLIQKKKKKKKKLSMLVQPLTQFLNLHLHKNNCTKNRKVFPFYFFKVSRTDDNIVKAIPVHSDPQNN